LVNLDQLLWGGVDGTIPDGTSELLTNLQHPRGGLLITEGSLPQQIRSKRFTEVGKTSKF
jgi:hypothetical protein